MAKRVKGRFAAAIAAGLLLIGSPAVAQGPVFGEIVWYQIDAYCIFTKAGHEFDYNNPDSWRFVAFSNYPSDIDIEPIDRLFMKVRGDLREFNLVEEREMDGVPQRIYQTSGTPLIEVELQLFEGEKGYESTAYDGVMIETSSGEVLDFTGDCGV